MKKSVGCFSEQKLKELASQPNTTVMQPTYDTIFEPWPAARVHEVMDQLAAVTIKYNSVDKVREECSKNQSFVEFSQKYKVMYDKMTTPLFVKDSENIKVLKKLILLKAAVDQNITSQEDAQAQASDIALKSLASRVKNNN